MNSWWMAFRTGGPKLQLTMRFAATLALVLAATGIEIAQTRRLRLSVIHASPFEVRLPPCLLPSLWLGEKRHDCITL